MTWVRFYPALDRLEGAAAPLRSRSPAAMARYDGQVAVFSTLWPAVHADQPLGFSLGRHFDKRKAL